LKHRIVPATGPLLLSSVYVQFGIRAGQNEIEAVHPTGTTAAIFDANGGFHGFDGITVRKRFTIADAQFAPDRRVNQIWTAEFDPPNAASATTSPRSSATHLPSSPTTVSSALASRAPSSKSASS
jgi:hypothetical protein